MRIEHAHDPSIPAGTGPGLDGLRAGVFYPAPRDDQYQRHAADGLEHLGTADDGGPRRQPELSEVTEYQPEQAFAANDLALLDDDDAPLPLPRQLDPALQRTAGLASLDPDDGIQL